MVSNNRDVNYLHTLQEKLHFMMKTVLNFRTNVMPKLSQSKQYMHNKLMKSNKHDLYCIKAVIYNNFQIFTKLDIIKNCDVLMTIIVMLKIHTIAQAYLVDSVDQQAIAGSARTSSHKHL